MPGFGLAGASLLLQGRAGHTPTATGNGGRDTLNTIRSKPALIFLLINTFFVGATVIGLPVTASGGYGSAVVTYLIGAIISLINASLSLALSVMILQATSADERSERAGLAMSSLRASIGSDDVIAGQLQASERRVEEMDKKMLALLEQQNKLIEMLAKGAAAPSSPAAPQQEDEDKV